MKKNNNIVIYIYMLLLCLVTQSCLTLCDPMDCSLPGSSVYGILQARTLEWVAMPSSKGSSQPRVEPVYPTLAGRLFTTGGIGEAPILVIDL